MNDEPQSANDSDKESSPESAQDDGKSEGSGPVAGERLAEARREKQISIVEVAKELHLDENKVRALERNEFERLGAPVFAKGHLKKYAQLVGVNEADMMDDYYTLTRATDPPPVVVTKRRASREFSPGPIIAILILLAFIVFAYYWFALRTTAPAVEGGAGADVPDDASAAAVTDPASADSENESTLDDVADADSEQAESDEPTIEAPAANEPMMEPRVDPIVDDGVV